MYSKPQTHRPWRAALASIPSAKSNRWTSEQNAQLAAMRSKGFGFEAIALAVGHSADSCKNRAVVLGVYKGDADKEPAAPKEKRQAFHRESYAAPAAETRARGQWRPCLCCKKRFWSTGAGNRLCSNCRQISVSPLAMPARVLR